MVEDTSRGRLLVPPRCKPGRVRIGTSAREYAVEGSRQQGNTKFRRQIVASRLAVRTAARKDISDIGDVGGFVSCPIAAGADTRQTDV